MLLEFSFTPTFSFAFDFVQIEWKEQKKKKHLSNNFSTFFTVQK